MSEVHGPTTAADRDEVGRYLAILAEAMRDAVASVTGEQDRDRRAILTRVEAIKTDLTSVQRRASIEGLDLRCEWDELALELIALTKQLSGLEKQLARFRNVRGRP